MRSDRDAYLDRRLAALRKALGELHPRPHVRSQVEASLARREDRSARRRRRIAYWWLPAGIAAALPVAVWQLERSGPSNAPQRFTGVAELTEYVVVPTQMPILVHSETNGAEVYHWEARLVTDQRGAAQVIYVARPQQEF